MNSSAMTASAMVRPAAQAEFFFDIGSPASWLAAARLDALEARTGAKFVWRPMLLGGVFKATGNRSPAETPAKSVWARDDLAQWARRHGVEFRFNPHFPINTMAPMRAIAAMELEGGARDLAEPLFRAMWVEGANLGDSSELAAVLTRAGFDAARVEAAAQAPAAKDRLRATTDEAVARGAFGAPTFFVGERLFFGQDRLDFVEEALV